MLRGIAKLGTKKIKIKKMIKTWDLCPWCGVEFLSYTTPLCDNCKKKKYKLNKKNDKNKRP